MHYEFYYKNHFIIIKTVKNSNKIRTRSFFEYQLFDDQLAKLPKLGKVLVNTINQYSYCIAEKDQLFKESLVKADILLPDGIGIVWALRFLKGKKISKIAGADCHQYLLQYLNVTKGSCFYLGASEQTLKKIQKKNFSDYPQIRVGLYSPPFKSSFSKEDNRKMLKEVNDFRPDVLFIGMTAPKQEKWSYKNLGLIDAQITCCIGAVFDFYSGTVNRPNQFWINIGLEWLIRLINEPKRLWKRYLYFGLIFAGKIIIKKLVKIKNNFGST
ncbi:WecB/TagA/CpsF family glycosyltransferase [Flavobacteriaceae bacterium F89]|uniref:WecB/TagA/CpsF family glycosyltransferase n=1 Tax=Cerina litoralis TaxID=2874477 RepID=A0AAE3ESL2_9FLAO|nr:WecB/TagA/CpsF family glycosyltransferase [Cerina litoralis]MCG2459693.1 WecB/TagA/CpsF family glycosyltransferase [Cerina litoralis]